MTNNNGSGGPLGNAKPIKQVITQMAAANSANQQKLINAINQIVGMTVLPMAPQQQPAVQPIPPAPKSTLITAAALPKVKEKTMRRTLALTPQEFDTKLGIGMINKSTLRQLLDSKKSMPEVMEKVVDLMLETLRLWKDYYSTNNSYRYQTWGQTQKKPADPSNITQYDAEITLRRVLRRQDVPTSALLKCMEYRSTHGNAYRWEKVLFKNRAVPEEVFRARLVTKQLFWNGNNRWPDGVHHGNLDLELLENPSCPLDLVKLFENEVVRLAPHDIYDGPAGDSLQHILRRPDVSEDTMIKFAGAAPFVIIESAAVTPTVLNVIATKTGLSVDARMKAVWKMYGSGYLTYNPNLNEEKQDVTQKTTATDREENEDVE